MEAVKKIEIVTDSIELRNVVKLLEELGVSGYTVIRDVEGWGGRGVRSGDGFTDVFKNSYVMTACPPDRVGDIVAALRPILTRVGGIALVSDCHWVKH